MILADKIIMLRKKNGWSQEELADKLNVTRQSVSKWEGAQSIPDLNKILLMSQIFDVSTDFLLKDDLELEPRPIPEDSPTTRRVTLMEAQDYLTLRRSSAKQIGLATVLCILSPICLFILIGLAETGRYGVTAPAAEAVGMTVIALFVAAACAIFILCGMRSKGYEFLEKESFEIEYGVAGMVKEKRAAFLPTYAVLNAAATVLCILAAVPLFLLELWEADELYVMLALCLLLVAVAVAVYMFIYAGVIWASILKLLQEGDYSPAEKSHNKKMEVVSGVYWLVVTAIYLGCSFVTFQWHRSWIIWPVAAVLYAALAAIAKTVFQRGKA